MFINNTQIKKAFLGGLQLTSKNAFIGKYRLIKEDEPVIDVDYLWIQPLETSSIDMNVETGLAKKMSNMEYSFNKKTWNKFADIPGEGVFTSLADMQAANPNTVYCLISEQIKAEMDERNYGFSCYHWNDAGEPVRWPGKPATYEGQTTDGRYCYSYDVGATPVNVIFCVTEMEIMTRYQTRDIVGWVQNTYYNWENAWMGGSSQPIGSEAIGTYTWDTIDVPANTKVYLRNTETWQCQTSTSEQNTYIVTSLQSVNYNIGGDIETIQDYQNITTEITVYGKYFAMFRKDTHLVNAGELKLNYETIWSSCYRYMFSGCTSLTQAPELPATTLDSQCYEMMFGGCTSLTQAPGLPATTLDSQCYHYMFSGCTSLTTAPELPATTLKNECYSNMFDSCASLTKAPELPATTLISGCYSGMFRNCTSLTKAPELPATTLISGCYSGMFYGCTSLTQAPELPATTLVSSCYNNMFYGCTSLVEVTTYATEWNTNYTFSWLYDVSSTGDFYNLGGADIPSGIDGIPSDWTIKNTK